MSESDSLADLIPALDANTLRVAAAQLAKDGLTQIRPALKSAVAEELAAHLGQGLDWALTLHQGSHSWDATPEQQQAIGQARLEKMAAADAATEFRFLFDVVRVSKDPDEQTARGLLLDRLALAWSEPAALEIWRAMLGREDISGLEMLASRYRPAHFLTQHDDGNTGYRKAAFVLSLTHGWEAQWGGLLQFIDDEGDVRMSIRPRFNTLTLFTVPQRHIVSTVAAFAPKPRLSITGWLLGEPD